MNSKSKRTEKDREKNTKIVESKRNKNFSAEKIEYKIN